MNNDKITLNDLRKAVKLLHTEENLKECDWCKYLENENYTLFCPIHGYLQISKQQIQEIKNIFGF